MPNAGPSGAMLMAGALALFTYGMYRQKQAVNDAWKKKNERYFNRVVTAPVMQAYEDKECVGHNHRNHARSTGGDSGALPSRVALCGTHNAKLCARRGRTLKRGVTPGGALPPAATAWGWGARHTGSMGAADACVLRLCRKPYMRAV